MTHVFAESLKKGDKGERLFLKHFGHAVIKNPKLDGDFILKKTGQKIELKTDYHNPTGNLFIERFSDKDRQAPGGPWQALSHNCDYFAYLMFKEDKTYLFYTKALIEAVNSLKLTLIDIKNDTHTTQGYKVPIKDLEKISPTIYLNGKR